MRRLMGFSFSDKVVLPAADAGRKRGENEKLIMQNQKGRELQSESAVFGFVFLVLIFILTVFLFCVCKRPACSGGGIKRRFFILCFVFFPVT